MLQLTSVACFGQLPRTRLARAAPGHSNSVVPPGQDAHTHSRTLASECEEVVVKWHGVDRGQGGSREYPST